MFKVVFYAASFALSSAFVCADDSPVGKWKTIDEKTQQPKAWVEITADHDGVLAGKIVKLLPQTALAGQARPLKLCERCRGERKNQPLEGMVILWGLKAEKQGWEGGEILDPKTGETYSATVKLIDHGNKLEVRGFKGISLFGRTQVWERL